MGVSTLKEELEHLASITEVSIQYTTGDAACSAPDNITSSNKILITFVQEFGHLPPILSHSTFLTLAGIDLDYRFGTTPKVDVAHWSYPTSNDIEGQFSVKGTKEYLECNGKGKPGNRGDCGYVFHAPTPPE